MSAATVTRSKTMELSRTGPDHYRLLGRLTDTSFHGDYGSDHGDGQMPYGGVIHDFVVDGELQGADLIVTNLDVRAETHPYRQCPAILPSCQTLVGKSLAGGWRRTVLETLGATAGCTHVTTLLLGLAEARTMAFFLRMNAAQAYTEQTRADGRWTAAGLDLAPSIVDACHVLSSSGSVIHDARNVAKDVFHDRQQNR
jgi:hypothetical protein